MKRVLVTGAAGFIGSHLTEALVKRGDRVRAFIRYNSTNSWGWLDATEVRKELEVVRGDLKDGDAVRRAVKGVEIVYHLGALIAIPYSYVHPNDVVQTNVLGTLHVLQACLETSARLVHTSTSEVYGTARHVPIDEARHKIGTYADALVLDQVVRSPRARALGWTPTLHSVAGNAARLLEEWRASQN